MVGRSHEKCEHLFVRACRRRKSARERERDRKRERETEREREEREEIPVFGRWVGQPERQTDIPTEIHKNLLLHVCSMVSHAAQSI